LSPYLNEEDELKEVDLSFKNMNPMFLKKYHPGLAKYFYMNT